APAPGCAGHLAQRALTAAGPGYRLGGSVNTEGWRAAHPAVSHLCYFAPRPEPPEKLMSTTTIRLPEDLKARVAKAAEAAGTTSHNFILEAIAEKADLAERRVDFHAQ